MGHETEDEISEMFENYMKHRDWKYSNDEGIIDPFIDMQPMLGQDVLLAVERVNEQVQAA